MRQFGCSLNPPREQHDCYYLKRGILRDSSPCLEHPMSLLNYATSGQFTRKWKEIRGKIRYLGFYPSGYRYWVRLNDRDEIEVKASVHFKNLSEFNESEIIRLEGKFDRAASHWKRYHGDYGRVHFKFSLERDPNLASIRNVRLIRESTRGPYYSKWSLGWSASSIAHEFGHVLGLDDEYRNQPGRGDSSVCSRLSRMCTSGGRSKDYHYYLILRRVACVK